MLTVPCHNIYVRRILVLSAGFMNWLAKAGSKFHPHNFRFTIIKFFPNGIFTSVGKYSNSDVELTVEFPPIYLGQPF